MKYNNMKTHSYFLAIAAVLFFVACEDEDKIRIPQHQTAANMRLPISLQ
jgi:hypothetical protein